MNSGVKILRVILILLQFAVLYADAVAWTALCVVNSESDYFCKPTSTIGQQGNVNHTFPDIKNATPNIELTLTPFGATIAHLTWTTTDYTIPGTYNVERLDPLGWVVLHQLPYDTILVYNDTISYPYCALTRITYRIRFVSAVDNVTSTQQSASLFDQNSPADVKNLNVDLVYTANNLFLPRVTWDKMATDSIFEYHIQRFDPITLSWPDIGIVSADSSGFNDQIALNPCENSYKYVIVAYDMCGNRSSQLYDDIYVQTIKLDIAEPELCEKSAKLSWNSNHTMPGGITGFKIYRSDGGPAVEIGSVTSTVTTYVDNFNFVNGISYGYSVTAYSDNSVYTSSSCQFFQQYNGAIQPDTVYVTQVTVKNDSYIEVGCYFTPGSSVVQLILERSENNGTTFHAIESLTVSGPNYQYYFNDTTVNVHSQSYSYRVIAIDTCGNKKTSVNVSRSIYIQCGNMPSQNNLNWNSYETWLQGVEGYEIHRILDGQSASIVLLNIVDQATVSYSDLHSGFDQSKLPCYWVVANENAGNSVFQRATSTSNTCCVIRDPVLFMPNAFYPDGANRFFRPVPTPLFVDEQSFKMIIFNRWGQQIFETTDMVNGWNGMVNGQLAPAGMYSYILTYSSVFGKEYTKRGTVTLIR